jgi:hypothetical protein
MKAVFPLVERLAPYFLRFSLALFLLLLPGTLTMVDR